MAISKVVVVDGNNLIVRIDRGVAGRGVTDVEPVVIDGSLYLVFTFSDGTTETVGPVGTIQYVGQAPIVVNGSTISLSTVPVNLGGTGQVTANAGFNALAPSQTTNAGKYLKTDGTNSAWDLLDISTADITGVLPLANGGTASSTASGARTNLGLGTIATQNASSVAITGGTITGITDLAVADGGTGSSTAAGARTNLNAVDQATTLTAGTGLSGGGDLTANRSFSITNTGVTAAAYGAASKTLTATVNAQGQLTVLADTPIAITNTQISGLGTMSTQNANAVAITGGTITGITDLAVADGGTGASDAAGARTNLNAANQATTITAGTGLSGGGDLSANRTIDIANTTVTAGAFGSASNTLTATVNAQGQLTALAATPIAIANTQVSGLGTMSTQNSNAVTITGGSITGITDLAIADGGTGASNAADARSNLGLGTAAVLNAGVALGVATLDAGGTVPLSQIPASIQGGVSYQGAWNASTNTPTLVSSVGSKGYYYVVSVAGNTNLNGVTDWLVGDWAIYNGTAWQKIDNTDQVASVNGYTGVVVLSNTDVGAPPTSLTISAGTGLNGGGSLAANRTLSIANTTVTAAPYGTASAVPTFTVNGQGQLTAASNVTIAIANTQVSGLGTMSTQNANSVAITGGSITGITDLAVADGGTGASTAADARTNLSAAYNAITISAGTGLTGGGDLTANRTLAIDSTVTTLTGTQTLTNKTFTSPKINEILDTNGNEILGLSPTASATDFVTVKNGIGVGVPLHIYADGSSANIGLHLQPKGTGLITISDGTDFNKGIRFRSSGSAASAVTLLDAVATAGRVVTLPDATTTLVGRDTTDTLTNKTIAFGSNTFSGSLAIANGGTGQTTAATAITALSGTQTSGYYLRSNGTNTALAAIVAGDVPTLNQNTTGTAANITASSNATLTTLSSLSLAGSQVTGNISGNAANVTGTVAIANGGTGQATANAAFNALAPSQTGNSGKYLTTDGTDTSWASNPLGTVTSVGGTGTVNGITLTGTVTSSGNLTLGGTLSGVSLTSQVTGTLPTANGGTNLTSFTSGGVVYASSSSALATGSALTFNGSVAEITTGNTGGTNGFTAGNSIANGYAALTVKNTGASGKTYEVGVGGNGTAGNYQNNLYIRDTSGNPTFYVNSTGIGAIGKIEVVQSYNFPTVGFSYNHNGYLYALGGTNGIIQQIGGTNITTLTTTGLGIGAATTGKFLAYQSNAIQNNQGAYGSSGTFQTGSGALTLGGGANPRGIGVVINANRDVGTTLTYGNNYETFGLIAVANVGTGGGYGTTGVAGYAESDGGVYGLRADAKTTSVGGASIAVGLYVGSVTGSSTNYGVYVNDTAASNYFGGKVGINNATPTTRFAVTLSDNEASSMTSASGTAAAIAQNQGEIRECSFNVTSTSNFVISSIATTSTGWRLVFRGTWSNNYEGGGLASPPPYIEVNAANPSVIVGSRTLTVSRNGSGYLIVNSADSYNISFAGTVEIYQNPQSSQPTQSMRLLGGIQFPATQSASSDANTLDDYEEGTWTPAFTSTGASFTYPRGQIGKYIKIGNLVYAQFYLGANASGTTSNGIQISGLPFVSDATALVQGTASAWVSQSTNLGFTVNSGLATVTLWPQNSGAGSTAITSQVAGGYLVGAIIYQT